MPVSISGSGPITGLTSIASPTTLNGLTIPTAGFGKVLQVVRSIRSGFFETFSTTFVDISDASISITPLSSSSGIYVFASGYAYASNANSGDNRGYYQLTNSSNTAMTGAAEFGCGLSQSPAGANESALFMMGYNAPNTTSTVTYKARCRSGRNTTATGIVTTLQMIAVEVSA